ncbi:MAG: hypothetical protein U0528_03775 [Anaerolineae bacterium]
MRFFALTFRGLEQIAAAEIADLADTTVEQIAYRRVGGSTADPRSLLTLRCADDVFLLAAEWQGIIRPRSSLALMTQLSQQLDLAPVRNQIAQWRKMPKQPLFSVTASFVGKRNYSVDEIKQAVAHGITDRTHWSYTADDASADLNIRVFIEHDTALIGVRVGKLPLHDRPYREQSQAGMLKAPVAAAMVRLAQVQKGDLVVDPCCGSGTILLELESLYLDAYALGGDLVIQNYNLPFAQWDVRRLPLPDHSVNCLISNLPWGEQVSVAAPLDRFYHELCSEIARVVAPAGRIVLLTSTPELITLPNYLLEQQIEISLFGQTPTIMGFASKLNLHKTS